MMDIYRSALALGQPIIARFWRISRSIPGEPWSGRQLDRDIFDDQRNLGCDEVDRRQGYFQFSSILGFSQKLSIWDTSIFSRTPPYGIIWEFFKRYSRVSEGCLTFPDSLYFRMATIPWIVGKTMWDGGSKWGSGPFSKSCYPAVYIKQPVLMDFQS